MKATAINSIRLDKRKIILLFKLCPNDPVYLYLQLPTTVLKGFTSAIVICLPVTIYALFLFQDAASSFYQHIQVLILVPFLFQVTAHPLLCVDK